MAGESVLAKLAVQITANNAQFNKGLSESNKTLKSFTSGVENIAATLGAAFAVDQIASFAIEVSKLAGEFKGVDNAFSKLPESERLMTRLKIATHDTVSELALMKRTTQAANFGISLEALPKLLEFATLRAQQTGQSVDYLVDSIVTGIGRKSPLILDNLGISAVALKDKLGGVSIAAADVGTVAEAVGKIAEEELQNMGTFSDNTKSKFEQLEAAWENFKVSSGQRLNASGVFGSLIDGATDLLNTASGSNKLQNAIENLALAFNAGEKEALGFNEAIKEIRDSGVDLAISEAQLSKIVSRLKNAADVGPKLQKVLKDIGVEIININQTPIGPELFKLLPDDFFKKQQEAVDTLDSLKEKLKQLGDEFSATDIKQKSRLVTIADEIRSTQAQIDKIEALKKSLKEFTPITIDLDFTKSVDFQESINQQLLDARFTNPITIPIDVEVDPESTEEADRVADSLRVKWENTASAFEAVTRSIENSVASAIQGQLNFAQALIGITLDIVDLYLKQALAAAIAKAIQSGGPLPVGLALAGIGVTAVKALFSKNIGSSGSGGGSSVAASAQNSNRVTSAEGFFGGGEIRLVASGPDLVGVIRENNFRGNRTRGG